MSVLLPSMLAALSPPAFLPASFGKPPMASAAELEPLKRVAGLPPPEVLTKAQSIRSRSRQCAELAESCITAEGRAVLSGLATQLGKEADELEKAVLAVRRSYGASEDAAS